MESVTLSLQELDKRMRKIEKDFLEFVRLNKPTWRDCLKKWLAVTTLISIGVIVFIVHKGLI